MAKLVSLLSKEAKQCAEHKKKDCNAKLGEKKYCPDREYCRLLDDNIPFTEGGYWKLKI